MIFFDRKLSLFILLFCLPLLFLPKINLISLDSGETAGLRFDDIILLFLGIILMWTHFRSQQHFFKIEGWILLITVFSVISFLMNQVLVISDVLAINAKIFYSFRILEYFLFFYVGAMATQYFSGRAIVFAFFLWNLFLMTLQKLNWAGGIISKGYQDDISARVQGIASFPSEMGLLLNLIFCYLIFDESLRNRFVNLFQSQLVRYLLHRLYYYLLFFLFGIFIIFTGNRISIFALVICFFYRLLQELNLRSIGTYISLIVLVPVISLGIGFVIKQTAGVYERSADLFSWKNLELFSVVWENIETSKHPLGDESIESKEIESTHYDMSWWIRVHKWLFMIKSYVENPESYLQGLGPGYAGAALDGGILRIITEYGLIGSFLFWNFFSCLFRINPQTKWMGIAFFMNMIFFDAYLAYKSMSFLLFTCGYIFQHKQCLLYNLQIHQRTCLNSDPPLSFVR